MSKFLNSLVVVVVVCAAVLFAAVPVAHADGPVESATLYQCKAAQINRTTMQIAGPQVVRNGAYVCQTRAANRFEIARWDTAAKLRAAKASADKAVAELGQGVQDLVGNTDKGYRKLTNQP